MIKKIEYYEIEAKRNDFVEFDISTGEDMVMEININPYNVLLNYFVKSNSLGRKKISRNEAIVYFNNYKEFIYRK